MSGLAVPALLMHLINCSSGDAEKASQAICRTPEAIAALASACGASKYAVGAGGVGTLVGLSTGSLPLAAAGAGVGAVGALGVRRFCNSAVEQATQAVGNAARIAPTTTNMLGAYYPAPGGRTE